MSSQPDSRGSELVVSIEAPFEERFAALDATLAAMPEAILLLMNSDEGTHLTTNVAVAQSNERVQLVMSAMLFLIEGWQDTVGEAAAESLFAVFVASVAEKMGWRQTRGKRRAN